MAGDTAILAGILFGIAAWLLMQRSFVRILFGLMILSNAANIFVVMMSGNPSGRRPPLAQGALREQWVDPLPQALVLTAIVIGFGVIAYVVTLLYRLFLDSGTTDVEALYSDEPSEREKSK